jgi:hypothetical protein
VSSLSRCFQAAALVGVVLSLTFAANAQLMVPWASDDGDTQTSPASDAGAGAGSPALGFSASDFAGSTGVSLDPSLDGASHTSPYAWDSVTLRPGAASGLESLGSDQGREPESMGITPGDSGLANLNDVGGNTVAVPGDDAALAGAATGQMDALGSGSNNAVQMDSSGRIISADGDGGSGGISAPSLLQPPVSWRLPNLCALVILVSGGIGFAIFRLRRRGSGARA